MSYQAAFLGASDKAAFRAIRMQHDGGIEPITGMKAGQDIDNSITTDMGRTHDSSLDMSPNLA